MIKSKHIYRNGFTQEVDDNYYLKSVEAGFIPEPAFKSSNTIMKGYCMNNNESWEDRIMGNNYVEPAFNSSNTIWYLLGAGIAVAWFWVFCLFFLSL